MLNSFWEKAGENLASLWSQQALSLAFAFWGCGLGLCGLAYGWDPIQNAFTAAGTNAAYGGALLVAALVVVAFSSVLVNALVLPGLRCVEGYWWGFIRNWAVAWELGRRQKLKAEYSRLQKKMTTPEGLTPFEARDLATLEYRLRYEFPEDEALLLPTAIGNVLRAAEAYPLAAYGLQPAVTWPHLWLVMPQHARDELSAARQALDESVRTAIWCLLFAVWVIFAWWVAPLALLAAGLMLFKIKACASTYAQLIRAAYDLYRFDLYGAVRLPAPRNSGKDCEKPAGQALTDHLYRHDVSVYFTHKKD